jgi:phosphatidylserine/phosphatidylglycerophosphate/cardiolipin synthase-like enzyme
VADLTVTFLQDGGQTPEAVAARLTAFFAAARASLEVAIYDCALDDALARRVAGALNDCAARGVTVRLAHYAGERPQQVLPPPPRGPDAFLGALTVPVRPVVGYEALMHHKYVARDAGTEAGAVWTGSLNWSDDAWGRQENVVLEIPSPELAALYRANFEELWARGDLENTGHAGEATLQFGGAPVPAHVWFAPGRGRQMTQAVAHAIATAERRVLLAAPVLTAGAILGALADVLGAGRLPIAGVYDRTQMDEVEKQWQERAQNAWKIAAFDTLVRTAGLSGKRSVPYGPGRLHDYMHAKIVVADDTVFAGSYNFSRSGQENAENLLRLESASLADQFADFVREVQARYAEAEPGSAAGAAPH